MTPKKPTSSKNKKHIARPPSDALFKKIMENKVAAQEFLEYYLPADFKALIDLSDLKVEKESYVDETLKRNLSDIVYSVKTKDNEKAFVYVLVEGQSTSDHWIALRLWKYMLLLSERHKSKKDRLQLIAPIVFYHGSKKYDAPRNLWDLFTEPAIAKRLLTKDYQLIDLQNMPDDEIKKKEHLGMLEYFLKNIHLRDMLKLWEDFLKQFDKAILIDRERGYVYIKQLLLYTDSKVPEDKQQELSNLIIEHLSDGENLMRTIAQKYIDEGIEKGKAEGIQEGVIKTIVNMLKKKADIHFISEVTGYTTQQITNLKKNIDSYS